jgi:hypothetical protein
VIPEGIRISAPAYDAISAWGITIIAVVTAAVFVWMFSLSRPRRAAILGAAVIAVMSLSAYLASIGLLSRFDRFPPPMFVMIVAVFSIGIGLGCSRIGRLVADHVPLSQLIGLQMFRLPLELVMHRAGELGIMPPELSYSGYNFDIVTGTGACLLFVLMRARFAVPESALWGWNVWGAWCLLVIAGIAVTTSPVVRLFGDDPRHVNTWVLFFPYVWLPVVLVTIAVAGHIVIARALMRPTVTTRRT